MMRLLVSAPLALCLSLLLFYGLALMTSVGDRQALSTRQNPALDFLMVRQESAIEARERVLPPEPETLMPQQEPDIPPLQPQTTTRLSVELPDMAVPDISTGIEVSLSPSLHNLSLATQSMQLNTSPTVLSQIPPRYPHRALRRRQEGRVVVEFIITEQGTVKSGSVTVVESSPPGVFDQAVMSAIQAWRFETRTVNGQAVPFRARQELEFRLEK
ncbi:TonB family protein [Pontibacterium granulatum]|uniref:energy transducer TonB n=1 Tax=Pontibacterium granulatum TaxID=2036029 RepID=UPI00249AD8C9|nr:energy transducer TonB [Pontibacterium granulatum]MDI3324535.1 TonB family protein [Pontibacterium granulatum]